MKWRRSAALVGLATVVVLAAAWWMRVVPETSAAEAHPFEDPGAQEDATPRSPAPRLRPLPPLPPADAPDTGWAGREAGEEPAEAVADVDLSLGLFKGDIVDTRGRTVSGAWLVGEGEHCPRFAVPAGRFEVYVPTFSCDIYAVRMDGALPTRSDRVWVDLGDSEVADVELVLPAERTGGIGIWIAEHEEGILVRGVLPGTPAWKAGLEPGDIVVEVDGTPAALLTATEFQEVMTGPEDTEVHFVVAYEDEEEGWVEDEVVAVRQYLEEPRRY